MSRWQPRLIHPTPYGSWLRTGGSLTEALRKKFTDFNVVRLSQRLARPHRDELSIGELSPGRLAMVREVLLRCGDTPLVFAHSVIPEEGLRGPWIDLVGLGNRPLGAALFSDPRIERQPLEFKRLDKRHPLHRKACLHLTSKPATLWARRSQFSRDGHPILVTEVFLPAVLHLK